MVGGWYGTIVDRNRQGLAYGVPIYLCKPAELSHRHNMPKKVICGLGVGCGCSMDTQVNG